MFSLRPWSAQIQTEFHVLRPTQVSYCSYTSFAYGVITLLDQLSQHCSAKYIICNCTLTLYDPTTPAYSRFRLFPFRSPLLRESLRFLLYPATEMFHFADFAP